MDVKIVVREYLAYVSRIAILFRADTARSTETDDPRVKPLLGVWSALRG